MGLVQHQGETFFNPGQGRLSTGQSLTFLFVTLELVGRAFVEGFTENRPHSPNLIRFG